MSGESPPPDPVADTDAAPWLARLLRVMGRREPALAGARFRRHASGMVVVLPGLGREVLVQPASVDQAWGRSRSLALSVLGDAPLGAEPERVLSTWLNGLRRTDPGGLTLPEPHRTHEAPAPGAIVDAVPDPADHAAARRELADELHRAAYVAWRVIRSEDLYPHVGPLGTPLSHQDLLDGWQRTLARRASGAPPDKLGLYVHVPFCTVACTFCYCGKTDNFSRAGFDTYVEGLLAEARGFQPLFAGHDFTSVYFGGGTPSLLSPPAMSRLFRQLHQGFDIPDGTQIIYEGNPDSLSDRKIGLMATEGHVTRLTIGVQTLDDTVQAIVRRHNKPEHVSEALRAARAWGIRHVNTDLMAGLPGQSLASFQQDLEFLLSLEPDSIHLNAYRPLPRVPLSLQGVGDAAWVDLRNAMMAWGSERLATAGHGAEKGDRPRRTADAANLQEYDLRRQNSSLLGLGFPARAHAFGSYYYAPDRSEGFDPALQRELSGDRRWTAGASSETEEAHKYLVSNLRRGFSLDEYRGLFGGHPRDVAGEALDQLTALGVLRETEGQIETHTGHHGENLVYRVLLYSPEHRARAWAVWGGEYDPDADYPAQLRGLVESHG